MPSLSIAGIIVRVALDGASESAPELVGSDTRTYSGLLRTTERSRKRNWKFTTKGLITADAEALVNACANGAIVACTGDLLGDGVSTYQCRVMISETGIFMVRGGHRRRLTLTLRQAS